MNKRIISALLCLIFFVPVICFSVYAEFTGSVSVSDGVITVSGKTKSGADIYVYIMNNNKVQYGQESVQLSDITYIDNVKADFWGNYTYTRKINTDTDKAIYIVSSNGDNALVNPDDYILVQNQIFISPDGDDETGLGNKNSPYASIDRAKTAIKELKNNADYNGEDIIVNIMSGTYRVDDCLWFHDDISGTENGRVIFRGYGSGEAVFTNAKQIPVNALTAITDTSVLNRLPVSAQGKVLEVDLSGYVSENDYLGYQFIPQWTGVANSGRRGVAKLFLNDKSQTVARWPNNSFKDLLLSDGTSSVVSDGTDGDIVLSFDDANPMRWTNADDMVVRTYFKTAYHGHSYDVKDIDLKNKQISLDNIYETSINLNSTFDEHHRWYAENLLEEIDIPGEYYIDDDNKKLYYYPSYELCDEDVLELIATPYTQPVNMFRISGASYLSFENLTIDKTAYAGIVAGDGAHDIIIDGCKIGNTLSTAVQIPAGNNVVKNCVIYNTSGAGIYSPGSSEEDITNLKSSGVVIENNHIYNAAQNSTYPSPAIGTSGVGDIVRNNTVHKTPVVAVGFAAPAGSFENNEVYGTVYEATDSGTMHIGGDWRRFGINVEYNFFHDFGIEGYEDGYSSWPVAGIYWDEVHSGTVQNNNIIVNDANGASKGVFMNGGRNHTAKGNVMVGMNTAFQNPDTHSSYYVGFTERAAGDTTSPVAWPYHSGLNLTFAKFKAFYLNAKENNTAYYQKFKDSMDELYDDVVNTQVFSAKNLDFSGNVLVECDNESVFGGTLVKEQNRRQWDDEKKEYTLIYKTIDNRESVTVDNFVSDYTREDIFVAPQNGDYRVSEKGKQILGIGEDFELDESFDLQSIGADTEIELYDSFKKLYPVNGEAVYGTESVTLVWEPADFADKYIYTVKDADGIVVKSGTTMFTNAEVKDLESGKKYTWQVKAVYGSMVAAAENNGYITWEAEDSEQSFRTSAVDITVENISKQADKIYYNFINNTDIDRAMDLIIAWYDDNEIFRGCEIKKVTAAPGASSGTVDVTNTEAAEFKAFVFSSLEELKPLANSKIRIHRAKTEN